LLKSPQVKRVARRQVTRSKTRGHITIIGGGISGLYAALRYLELGYEVTLYEAQTRLGGRLLSVHIPGIGTALEAGAMRYTTKDELLMALIDELKLETVEFQIPTGYYLRETQVPVSTVPDHPNSGRTTIDGKPVTVLPYIFREDSRHLPMNPEGLISAAMVRFMKQLQFPDMGQDDATNLARRLAGLNEVAPDWDQFSKGDWKDISKYGIRKDASGVVRGETPLHDMGLQNMIGQFLGGAAEKFVVGSIGYDTVPSNWNLAAALEWFAQDFSRDTRYRMIVGGFGRLIDELEKRVVKEGGKILTSHQLVALSPLTTGRTQQWRLTFAAGKNREQRDVIASQVILALPPGPIEKLSVDAPRWDEFKLNVLGTVEKRKLLKGFLVYPRSWWEGQKMPGDSTARLFTDGHLRSIYYYGPEWLRDHSETPTLCNPDWAVIMVYTDGEHVDYFTPAMKGQPWLHADMQSDACGANLVQREKINKVLQARGASGRMVLKIHELLAEIHGIPVSSISMPLFAFYADWAGDPFEASGWHTWKCGVQPRPVARRMLDPLGTGNLSAINESHSPGQGWCEGSLRTAEYNVLAHHGLATASWVGMPAEDFREYVSP
jgi:hypothetical protein